jgi:hypothetical protein
MNDVFHTHLDSFFSIYLDDMLIYSRTIEDHLLHLRKILDLLQQRKLYAKMYECAFWLPAVEYLGYLLSDIGISVEKTKVDSIKSCMVPPRCNTDAQSFLEMVNFYRRFVMNCARISRPLTQLTGNTPFTLDDKTRKAFEQLKQAVCTAPVLRTFDPQFPIVLTTNTSGFAIGAVLVQEEDGFRRPVAYFSSNYEST